MTFGEIRFRLQKECPGTDPDVLDGAINDAYESILNRIAWKDLEADDRIQTVAVYATGSMALTFGSLSVTGVGTTWTDAMTGRGVFIPSRNESYRFNQISATTGALDRPYEGATAAASGYKIYQDIYELPADFERPKISLNERANGVIEFMTRPQVDRIAPARLEFGEPEVYSLVMPGPLLALVADDENDRKRAKLYPIPLYAAGYPIAYIRSVPRFADGDTDNVILPWVSTKALIDLSRAGIEAKRKDFNAAAGFTATAEVEIGKMTMADAAKRGPIRIRMKPSFTRHRMARAWRGAGRGRFLP